jgi:hypothetical protein
VTAGAAIRRILRFFSIIRGRWPLQACWRLSAGKKLEKKSGGFSAVAATRQIEEQTSVAIPPGSCSEAPAHTILKVNTWRFSF